MISRPNGFLLNLSIPPAFGHRDGSNQSDLDRRALEQVRTKLARINIVHKTRRVQRSSALVNSLFPPRASDTPPSVDGLATVATTAAGESDLSQDERGEESQPDTPPRVARS